MRTSFVNSELMTARNEGNELNTKEAYQMICRAIDNDAAEVNWKVIQRLI